MIEILVELEDLSTGEAGLLVTLPCDLKAVLEKDHEYVIYDVEQDIDFNSFTDVFKLNAILEEIENSNPDLTTEHLEALLMVSKMRLTDAEFIRRIADNEFMLEVLECPEDSGMDIEEYAACYLATELCIQFDKDVDQNMMRLIGCDEVSQYVSWSTIWRQYEAMGFRIVDDYNDEELMSYLIYWK